MLQRAQECVSLGQFRTLLLRDEIAIRESSQTYQCVGNTQPFIAAAMCQLQRLRDELNLANATALKLDVETGVTSLDVAIDLLFRQANIRQGVLN